MVAYKGQFYVALGRNIREAREAANLTQADLSARVHAARSAIIAFERGEQQVPTHLLVAIANVLGTAPSKLLPATDPLETRSKEERSWLEAGYQAALAKGS